MNPASFILDLRSYDRETRRHAHDYHQLVLPVSGALQMQIGSREGLVDGRQAAVIGAGEDHAFAGAVDNRFIVADIPVALAPLLQRLPAFVTLDDSLGRYIRFLQTELEQGGSAVMRRQMLLLLIELLNERHGAAAALDRRLRAAQVWMDEHLEQPVTLGQVAAAAHISPRQLSALFRQTLAMTPQQYLLERRMQTAWALLEAGELSIQRIAERVGYSSLAAFSDRFRRHFGKSPRYFRGATHHSDA
ncbi:AraC family transcriptional regulator [Marinobacterium rhizophilum]|uniref:Helix-turn-helix domain-containing protein n=1 Tax=Marinobacterium rhizophilum TaxID=420402 RepID=A0ABY5HN94_9GAMM|nr:AraC family transcriptional regulator [Marinobacterium rhizophilum]UTW13409.1 helix-turn-helix domain-containing protein [Marinobacterium rhizophilum]